MDHKISSEELLVHRFHELNFTWHCKQSFVHFISSIRYHGLGAQTVFMLYVDYCNIKWVSATNPKLSLKQ